MSTGRLESFSDGVLAVAITLLVLNITVPDPAKTSDLLHALGELWPQYAAYATSFVTIGIIWINHHAMVSRLQIADRGVMLLNTLLLMSVVLLPFATDLMATYLRASRGEHVAAAVYGGSLLLMGVLFSLMNGRILVVKPELMAVKLSEERRRQLLRRSVGGVTPYVVATALAPVSPYVTLIVTAAVAIFYALPISGGTGA